MSADLRCFDPKTGKVVFSLALHTTRLLGVVTDSSTSGTIKVNGVGNGTLFNFLLDDDINYVTTNMYSARLKYEEQSKNKITRLG